MDEIQREKRVQHKQRQLDMLHGSLWDKLTLFALPLALTGVLQQLFNTADVAVLGQFVSKEAMAAVGNNTPIISLFVTLFLGLSLGANVVIAQLLGARRPDKASEALHTALAHGSRRRRSPGPYWGNHDGSYAGFSQRAGKRHRSG